MKPGRPNSSTRWSVADKWGADVVAARHHGFVQLPDALIRYQAELQLSPMELCVLLHVLRFWWRADEYPHPPISLLAREIGVSRRTVERAVVSLERKGLVVRGPSEQKGMGGPTVRRFQFDGLRERLRRLVSTKEGIGGTASMRNASDDGLFDQVSAEGVIDEFDAVPAEMDKVEGVLRA